MDVFVQRVLQGLHLFALEELGRVALTALVLLLMPLSLRLARRLIERHAPTTMNARRERHVMLRNAIISIGAVGILSIWGSRIAGFALSLAAVAGAVLIVSKEALLNLIGFGVLTVSRPYGLGDYIMAGGASGRVVDINAMSTTILETAQGHQVTGACVSVPNSFVLTQAVHNVTATGDYVVYLLPVKLDKYQDIVRHEAALIEAAYMVCEPWQEAAETYLSEYERRKNVDLPSAQIRVLVSLDSEKYSTLTLRFACQPNDRVKVEQRILRHYIRATGAWALPTPVKGAASALELALEEE